MKRFILLFILPALLSASEVKVGMTETELVELRGKSDAKMSGGTATIYRWGSEEVFVKDGKVSKVRILTRPTVDTPQPTPKIDPITPAILPLEGVKLGIEFHGVDFDWKAESGSQDENVVLSPQIKFHIKNIRAEPIKSLEVKFVFMEDKNENKIWDEVTETLVYQFGTPLASGVGSKTKFAECSMGYRFIKAGYADNSRIFKEARLPVFCYVRTETETEWVLFSKFVFGIN